MWSVNLCFIDRDEKKIYKLKHVVKPLYTYENLNRDLSFLAGTIGWSLNNKNIEFKLASYTKAKKIDDWNRFILHRDTVHIIFSKTNFCFYTLSNTKGDIFLCHKSISKIYSKAQEIKNEILLICQINETKTKIKIIDVIDNPVIHYNNLVNRMIHNYYEKYHITL